MPKPRICELCKEMGFTDSFTIGVALKFLTDAANGVYGKEVQESVMEKCGTLAVDTAKEMIDVEKKD